MMFDPRSACILPQRESFHSFSSGGMIYYIFCLQASPLSVHHSLIIYCQYNPRPIDHVGCRQSSYNFLCCTATCRRGTLTLGVIACWRRYLIYIYISIFIVHSAWVVQCSVYLCGGRTVETCRFVFIILYGYVGLLALQLSVLNSLFIYCQFNPIINKVAESHHVIFRVLLRHMRMSILYR